MKLVFCKHRRADIAVALRLQLSRQLPRYTGMYARIFRMSRKTGLGRGCTLGADIFGASRSGRPEGWVKESRSRLQSSQPHWQARIPYVESTTGWHHLHPGHICSKSANSSKCLAQDTFQGLLVHFICQCSIHIRIARSMRIAPQTPEV